jgi:hypothetical protein
MSKGIVVDHKESGIRYAISEHNFKEKVHTLVRDLKLGESILTFKAKPIAQAIIDEKAEEEARAARIAEREAARAGQGVADESVEDITPDEIGDEIEKLSDAYTLDELKEFAKEEGLPVSGTKLELATALYEGGYSAPEPDDEPGT